MFGKVALGAALGVGMGALIHFAIGPMLGGKCTILCHLDRSMIFLGVVGAVLALLGARRAFRRPDQDGDTGAPAA